ncbi:MAG TPA: dihydrofolate reductase [Fibrobacteres bacterium]|jgi:D-3-phosphoglycerate dehydrogenase|nr:dihydrofolate reductase [Fibrobacterota bacterium]
MKVVVTDCNFESFSEERAMCERNGYTLEIHQCKTPEEVIAIAADADALFVQYVPITDAVLAALKCCKAIVRYGIGLDNIDLAAAHKHNVPVCNVPDYGIDEVADHAAALTLALLRQLPFWDHSIRQNRWPSTAPTPMLSCKGMTFAVAGAGRIGRATLERMHVFGFKLAAYDPFVPEKDLSAIGVEKLSLDELFTKADVLSLHLPLTKETHHLVNRDRLKSMKKHAILINTSRGGLIDTYALAAALDAGDIGHAGIDVHEKEPMDASHPLKTCQTALLTPHIAYYSAASIVRLQRMAAEEVERALYGKPLRCQFKIV